MGMGGGGEGMGGGWSKVIAYCFKQEYMLLILIYELNRTYDLPPARRVYKRL